MGLAFCVPTCACRFSYRAGLHLPFHLGRFPIALGIHPGRATIFVVLQHCLWGRGQRGNSAAPFLICSTLSKGLSCETGSFSHCINCHCPLSTLSLNFSFSQPRLQGLPLHHSFFELAARFATLPVWLFWLTFSLIPWLSEFHAV